MRPFETCGNEQAWREYQVFMKHHRRGAEAVREYRRAVFFEFERECNGRLPGVRSRRQRIPFVVETVAPRPSERLLEVGCGFGPYLHRCALRDSTCIGIDLDSGLLAEARRYLRGYGTAANCRWACANGLRLPFRDDAFDKLLCSDVVEHISLPNQRRFLAELRRVVRPGGTVYLQTPNLLRAQGACLGRKWLAMLSGRDWQRYAVPWDHEGGHTGISSPAALRSRIARVSQDGDRHSVHYQVLEPSGRLTARWLPELGWIGDLLCARALIVWELAVPRRRRPLPDEGGCRLAD